MEKFQLMPILFLLSANFIFYITFVQFGLLRMIDERFGLSIDSLGLPLGLMALTGAASSILAGYLLDRSQVSLKTVFKIACVLSIIEGFAAFLSINIYNQGLLTPLFCVLGLMMGANGVLVIRVVEVWPAGRRGILAGISMALVYLPANVMAGSIALAERVALTNCILVMAAGALCLTSSADMNPSVGSRNISFSYPKSVIILASFVAVDSFIFHIETNREDLYRHTWDGRWLLNGIVHSLSAVAAGFLWDRRGERPVFAVVVSAFLLSSTLFIIFPVGYLTGLVSTLFYNTAVSFYGILLLIIWFYVDSGIGAGLKIGLGMGVVGWLASPLGIMTAMKLISEPVPLLFIGPLSIITVLALINARIMNLPQRPRHTK